MPASAASRAPATTSPGARSPPMASTATTGARRAMAASVGAGPVAAAVVPPASAAVTATWLLDLDGLASAVPATVGADQVGQLRLVTVGADRAGGGGRPPVRGPPAAALGLGSLPLGDGHRGSYSCSVRFGAELDVIGDDEGPQGVPAGVGGLGRAVAGVVVQVGAARRAQAEAVVSTEGDGRQLGHHQVAEGLLE